MNLIETARIHPREGARRVGCGGAGGPATRRCDERHQDGVVGPSGRGVPLGEGMYLAVNDVSTMGLLATRGGCGEEVLVEVGGGVLFDCVAPSAGAEERRSSAVGADPRVSFILLDCDYIESRLLGVDSLKPSFEETADILRQTAPGIESGTFPPPRVDTLSLEEASRLYRDIAESKI